MGLYEDIKKKYETCSDDEIYLLLDYLNNITFLRELWEEDGLTVEQTDNLFDILVKRAVDIGEQLPNGYINLYDYAERKGWIK